MRRTRNQTRKATEDANATSAPSATAATSSSPLRSSAAQPSKLPPANTDDQRNVRDRSPPPDAEHGQGSVYAAPIRKLKSARKRKVKGHANPSANRLVEQRRSKRRRTVKISEEDEELDGGHADDVEKEFDESGPADQGASADIMSTDVGKKDGQLSDTSGGNQAGNDERDVADVVESESKAGSQGENTEKVIEIATTHDDERGSKDGNEGIGVGEEGARGRDSIEVEANRVGGAVETVSLETITYPDNFLVGGGNKTAFKYEMLSGQRLSVNFYDIYHASMPRLMNEVAMNVASDRILRNRDCTTEAGWIWMYETHLIADILAGRQDAERAFSVPRTEQILSSSVLFVPMQTNASGHWSLLVIVNLKSLLEAVLRVKPPVRGRLPRAELNEEQPTPFALHFDSFSSSGHKSTCPKVVRMLSNFLSDAWKKEYRTEWRLSNFSLFVRSFVCRSIKPVSAKVEQQEDAYTCGWRVLDAVRFITERRDTVVQNIREFSEEQVQSDYVAIAANTLRFMKEQTFGSIPDAPMILYRAHLLLDELCCSAFDTNPSEVNDVMVSFFDVQAKQEGRAGNRKKILQKQKFEYLYSAVASEMEKRSLMTRMRGKKRSTIPKSNCETIAKYLINLPRGSQYARCLYYTRYNYPTSSLLCTSLNMLVTKRPRAFGNEIESFSSRVLKSKRVLYQMAMFLDWRRSKARNWSRKARFRLQELELHFTGISEAVLLSCCRHAQYEEDNAGAAGLEQVTRQMRTTPSTNANSEVIIDSDEDTPLWNFDASVSIEEGDHENGQLLCSVDKEGLGTGLASCLNAAEGIANEAIMACITPFEEHCKKVVKMQDKKAKLSDLEHLVTEESMEEIHITLRKRFASDLVSKVKELWGHVLKDEFIEQSLKPMIDRLIHFANKCFKRNGHVILEISEPKTALFAEPIAPRVVPPDSDQHESAATRVVDRVESTTDLPRQSSARIVRVKEATSFGLGFHTSCHGVIQELDSIESTMLEFYSIFFYLLQGCRSHETDERHHCREFAAKKWGLELPECQKMLQDVWNSFLGSAKILRDKYLKNLRDDEHPTLERHLTNLKLDIVIHAAAKLADTTNKYAQNSHGDLESELFCYKIPDSYRGGDMVNEGGCFYHSINGEEDTALWHAAVTDITCTAVDPKQARICAIGEDAMLGDLLIGRGDTPKLYEMDLNVRIESDLDAWNGSGNVVGREGSFLGFKMHSVVRIVFVFNNGKPKHSFPHPVTGNYKQSLVGVIASPVSACSQPAERGTTRNAACVGPKNCAFRVILHDDVQQVSGCRSSVEDLVRRFAMRGDASVSEQSGCYAMPVEDMSLSEDVWQFNGIAMSKRLPKPILLSLFDAHMADAYESERKLVHYRALRASKSQNRLEQLRFPSLSDLEDSSSQEIRQVALRIDKSLNDEQLSIIASVLYGWRTKEAPNNAISLGCVGSELKGYLESLGTIPVSSMKWWGSRSCFIQGPPGTGKTRMLAALIAVVLEHLEPRIRILVVCETNKALDDIFVHLLSIFKDSRVAYRRVYESLVRIGYSKLKVVQGRETHNLRGHQAVNEVDKCRVVFTTFGSAHRKELVTSRKHFSLVISEESCLVKEATALHVLTAAHCRGSIGQDDVSRKSVWVVVGDHKQRHAEELTKRPVPRMVDKHFFDRVFSKEGPTPAGTRAILTTQYRMNPALATFVSKQFYDGKLVTEMEGNLPWKDNNLFKTLREHRRFPLRNVTVVDTSLEGRNARERLDPGASSFYNPFEVDVIANVLKTWVGHAELGSLQGKVTVITTYSKQRDELISRFRAENLHFPVHTVDEIQGGENDIIIVSLVRARTSSAPSSASRTTEIGFLANEERINVALSRAKQACMVVGFAKHIARYSPAWRNFFSECATNSSGEEDGSHAYHRLRYVQMERDMKFSSFNPTYLG